MKRDIALQWAAALRSGNYAQARGRLRTSHCHFCCLGVLCDLYDRNGWTSSLPRYKYGDTGKLPPSDVMEWAGMRTPDGHLIPLGESLAVLNDRGLNFSTIADLIEMLSDEL